MKACPYCGKEYPDDASICAIDEHALQSVIPKLPPIAQEEKNSRLGIASFSISIAVGFLILALFAIAPFLNAGRVPRGETFPGQLILGLGVISLLAADVVAIGLGIAAVCQSGKKRLFGYWAWCFRPEPYLARFFSWP
jgi:hypothetical protein